MRERGKKKGRTISRGGGATRKTARGGGKEKPKGMKSGTGRRCNLSMDNPSKFSQGNISSAPAQNEVRF